MTYDATENSAFDSEIAELYEFKFANSIWRYTSADEDQTYLGQVYTAEDNLTRGSVDQTQEINKSNVKITLPYDNLVAKQFIIYPPEEVMSLIIYRTHRNDEDATEVAIIWHGRVTNAEWSDSTVELVCEAIFTSLRRPGLRRRYQAQCPHILYGSQCTLTASLFELDAIVSSINNNIINVSFTIPPIDGYLIGGIFIYTDDQGLVHKRAIESNISNEVTISYPIGTLDINDAIKINPGCRHNVEDCTDKFDNNINYGGFVYSPALNPFDGKTLF